jgi:hypothetical protein
MLQKSFSELVRRLSLLILFCTLFSGSISAQNPAVQATISPYSRFGLGDLNLSGGLWNSGMGGGGIGLRNDSLLPQYINFQNPASFSSHAIITYEVAMMSNTVKLQSNGKTGTFNRSTINNFSLAFPVTKWWGAGFGLMPYSAVGYTVSINDDLANIGPVNYRYEGSGGVSQVFLTNGFRPFANASRHYQLSTKYEKLVLTRDTSAIRRNLRFRNHLANVSVGVNTSWLFGSLVNIRRDVFPDSAFTFNTKITKRTYFRDVYLNYGIQYTFRLRSSLNPIYIAQNDSTVISKSWFGNQFVYRTRNNTTDTAQLFVRKAGIRVTFGIVFSLPTQINTTNDLLAQTYRQIGTQEAFRDTVYSINSLASRVTLPAMAGFGIGFKKDYKWLFQADYMMQQWSNFSQAGVKGNLSNSQRITAGFQYQPKQVGTGKFLGVTQYRLGVRWYQTALELNNTQLSEMSANFSMSFPVPARVRIGEPVGRGTISFEYGIRGTTDNNLIQENFYRITVGISLNDKWFNRSKYD